MGLLDPPALAPSAVPPLVAAAVAATPPQDLRAAQLTARITNSVQFVSQNPTPPVIGSAIGLTTGYSLYFPQIVRVDDKIGDTAFPYRMLLSTDHDTGNGGIWVLKAPAVTGPWTNIRSDLSFSYQDTTSGQQTETPSVVWDAIAGLFVVAYQNEKLNGAVNEQFTTFAVTPDFVTWERLDARFDMPRPLWPGGGKPHTGYAALTRRGNGDWVMTHLSGAGNYTRYATSYSRDLTKWHTDPIQKTGVMFRLGADDRRVWPTGRVFRLNGELWATSVQSAYVSGPASGAPIAVAGPINPDLNSWVRTPEVLWQAKYDWEQGGSGTSTFIDNDGTFWLVVANGFNMGFAKATFKVEGVVS